jgi:hypothetical protein
MEKGALERHQAASVSPSGHAERAALWDRPVVLTRNGAGSGQYLLCSAIARRPIIGVITAADGKEHPATRLQAAAALHSAHHSADVVGHGRTGTGCAFNCDAL